MGQSLFIKELEDPWEYAYVARQDHKLFWLGGKVFNGEAPQK